MDYIYDGTFEGLLTSIYEAYYRRQEPSGILKSENLQQNLFDECIYIETDFEKSQKVYESIRKKVSQRALQHVYYTYLSDYTDSGTLIYRYLKLGFKVGGKIDSMLSDQRVLDVHNTSKKVSFERHRMLGLLRFKKVSDNLFYAAIEPDHNIVPVLASHFAKRFSDQNFIIHDLKRKHAVFYNTSKWVLTDFDEVLPDSFDERDYEKLWKEYFKSIAIKERVNPRLQKQFMPKRYWIHLTEKL